MRVAPEEGAFLEVTGVRRIGLAASGVPPLRLDGGEPSALRTQELRP